MRAMSLRNFCLVLRSNHKLMQNTQIRHLPIKCPVETPCADKTCNQKSFWKSIFSRKKKVEEVKLPYPPPVECCKVKFYADTQEDPDLSHLGGIAYKTCGRAYVVQKDTVPTTECDLSKEDKMVKKIETHPELKEFLDDPMPTTLNASQRLVEMSNRKLHPLYNKYRQMPKHIPKIALSKKCPSYRTISGPIEIKDIPLNIKFNKELLEKKNLYSEYKRVEPPHQLIGRLIEMKKNVKPSLETRRPPIVQDKAEKPKKKMIFDTLHQKDSYRPKDCTH